MATILADVAINAAEVLVGGLMLVGLFLVLGLGLWYYRRWRSGSQDLANKAPWTLDDLRNLREQGQLSEAEYQRLRSSIIGIYTGQARSDGLPTLPRSGTEKSADENWDWVAEDEPGSGGFDVKE